MSGNSLGWIILAFVLYLLMMVVIGAIYSRKNNSTEDYFRVFDTCIFKIL